MNIEQAKEALKDLGISFKITTAGLNFRCCICGDSKISKKKRRGWVLTKSDSCVYYCFNCGASLSMKKMLKDNYPELYKKYAIYNISNNIKNAKISKTEAVEIPKDAELIKIDLSHILNKCAFPLVSRQNGIIKLGLQSRAIQYVISRKIPKHKIMEMWVTFDDYINPTTKEIYYLKNRIIIPFKFNDMVYAFQARTLLENYQGNCKYITIKEDNDLKVYNYFGVNKKETVYILEGPINSFFVNNAIATSGTISPKSPIVRLFSDRFKDMVFVFDNDDAGNKRKIDFMKSGFKCFNWGGNWSDTKDINDVVLKFGSSNDDITGYISQNIASGWDGLIKTKISKI